MQAKSVYNGITYNLTTMGYQKIREAVLNENLLLSLVINSPFFTVHEIPNAISTYTELFFAIRMARETADEKILHSSNSSSIQSTTWSRIAATRQTV
jgi:hypothetical protein